MAVWASRQYLDDRRLDVNRQRDTWLQVSLQEDMTASQTTPSLRGPRPRRRGWPPVRDFIEFSRRTVEIDHAVVSGSVQNRAAERVPAAFSIERTAGEVHPPA